MKTIQLLVLCVALAGCRDGGRSSTGITDLVDRSCTFLLDNQSDDAGWHSETHALMSSGQATTPFVFLSLLRSCDIPSGAREAALTFVRDHVGANGAMGFSDPDILDFPNYATSYGLLSLVENGDPEDEVIIGRMRDYLVSQQFNESRGVARDNAAFGGWGFGETVFPVGSFGHVDLSHTSRALQAIRAAGFDDDETYRAAMVFLQLLQKDSSDLRVRESLGDSADVYYDGGFFASAVVPVVNKSVRIRSEPYALFTSYASATADGLLALLAAGQSWDSKAVLDAYAWLEKHADFSYPAGIPKDHPARWGDVMFFYHLMVRGEAYQAMKTEGPWRQAIVNLVAERQRADGSFSNPFGAPNKEDDPLLATAMVLYSIGRGPEKH